MGKKGDEQHGSSSCPNALLQHRGDASNEPVQQPRPFKGSGVKKGGINQADVLQNTSGSRSVLLLHSSRNVKEESKHILGLLFSGFSTTLHSFGKPFKKILIVNLTRVSCLLLLWPGS